MMDADTDRLLSEVQAHMLTGKGLSEAALMPPGSPHSFLDQASVTSYP